MYMHACKIYSKYCLMQLVLVFNTQSEHDNKTEVLYVSINYVDSEGEPCVSVSYTYLPEAQWHS